MRRKGRKGTGGRRGLPDGRLLFTVFMAGAGLNDNRVAVFDRASGRHQSLFAGVKASWLASGHLLFYRAGRYQVVPIRLKSVRTSGDAVVVLEDATELDPAGDWPQPVVVSASGALAYLPGPLRSGRHDSSGSRRPDHDRGPAARFVHMSSVALVAAG